MSHTDRIGRRTSRVERLAPCIALSLTVIRCVPAGAHAAPPTEAPFLAANQAAMDRMMAGMDVAPSGDVDHDFAAMMIPHHQAAVDMAQAELRNGHNEQLRRIAQGIIIEQQQEIAAMRLGLGQLQALSTPVPEALRPRHPCRR